MIDGRDSSGRVVSLLNDHQGAGLILLPAPRRFGHASSNPSSYRHRPQPLHSLPSTPSLSPQSSIIPALSRSESNDSRLFPTPSPITPSFGPYEDAAHPALHAGKNALITSAARPQLAVQTSLGPRHVESAENNQMHLPSTLSVTSNGVSRHLHHSNSDPGPTGPPTLESLPSTSSATSIASSDSQQQQMRLRKNQFPCPFAEKYDCPDFFTTSGHAARHAKKHTGKKDAFCPECGKAFTRKDNMEQHRRTHQTSKSPTVTIAKDNRVKKVTSAKPLAIHRLERSLTDSEILRPSMINRSADAMDIATDSMPDSPALTSPASSRHYQSSLNSPASAGLYPSSQIYHSSAQPSPTEVPSPGSQGRPRLQRSNLDIAFIHSRSLDSPTSYAHPSPGLSSGLDALALAASDHRRHSQGSADC